MKLAILVMTDGRSDYLEECVHSALDMLPMELVSERWMHDDTGDDRHRLALIKRWPKWRQCGEGPRRGFGGAIGWAWEVLRKHSDADFILHIEDDFTFNRIVPLDAMTHVLERNPHLVQLALRRQPWNGAEAAAGGIVEQHPESYEEMTDGVSVWLEHRLFFTTNPSLYRWSLCAKGWPEGPLSEGMFSAALAADPVVRFGFWGARSSGEWVSHIGIRRMGRGY